MWKEENIIITLCLAVLCLNMTGVSHAAEKAYANSIGMEFVLIPEHRKPAYSGSGGMLPLMGGGNVTAEDIYRGSIPLEERRKVTITKSFYLGKYPVTQAQWEAVMGNNPSKFKAPNNPVEQVSWDDVQEFIRRLNTREGHNRYRLPTDAEWKLAAGDDPKRDAIIGVRKGALGKHIRADRPSDYETLPVGQGRQNKYGLYDTYCNVYELVHDWTEDVPHDTPDLRVISPGFRLPRGRGYSEWHGTQYAYARFDFTPDRRDFSIGFRLALSLE